MADIVNANIYNSFYMLLSNIKSLFHHFVILFFGIQYKLVLSRKVLRNQPEDKISGLMHKEQGEKPCRTLITVYCCNRVNKNEHGKQAQKMILGKSLVKMSGREFCIDLTSCVYPGIQMDVDGSKCSQGEPEPVAL